MTSKTIKLLFAIRVRRFKAVDDISSIINYKMSKDKNFLTVKNVPLMHSCKLFYWIVVRICFHRNLYWRSFTLYLVIVKSVKTDARERKQIAFYPGFRLSKYTCIVILSSSGSWKFPFKGEFCFRMFNVKQHNLLGRYGK